LVVEFTVESGSVFGLLPLAILGIIGAVFIARGVARWRTERTTSSLVIFLVIGLVAIGVGAALGLSSGTPSEITVGNGYVYVQSPTFTGPGDTNITSSQISAAHVGDLGSGNLSLSKQYGTNIGELNIGMFTLDNGPTAFVVSDNSTSLVIHLDSGGYVILGTTDTNELASAFSQSVHPVEAG
jgi:hypothetical protein